MIDLLHDGPLKDEGDVIVGNSDSRIVLECHESGPEIIVYLGFATASVALATSVINLITTIIKTRQDNHKKHSGTIKLTKKIIRDGEPTEEHIMEVDLPLTERTQKELNNKIEKIF